MNLQQWLVAIPSLAMLLVCLQGCGGDDSNCGLLKSLHAGANVATQFCSSGVGAALSDAKIRKSKRMAYKVGTKAQTAYKKVCEAGPKVTDMMWMAGEAQGCISETSTVWMTCFSTPKKVSRPGSESAWETFIEEYLNQGGSRLELGAGESIHSASGASLMGYTLKPKLQIDESTSWFTCTSGNMDTCGDYCCCNSGHWWNGDNCVELGAMCRVGIMFTSSDQETLDSVITGYAESKATLDTYAVQDGEEFFTSLAKWNTFMSSIQAACPSVGKVIAYSMVDSSAGDSVKACFVNIAVTEDWGDYEANETVNGDA